MSDNFLQSSFKKLDGSIREIHEMSKTDLITIHIQTRVESLFATYQLSENGKSSCISHADDERVFAVASLFKPFIATGVALMIDKLSISPHEEHKRYHGLKGAWNRDFTDVFNSFCNPSEQIEPLKDEPTVKQILVHFQGAYNMNHLLLSPDGSPLLSADDFLAIISNFTQDTYKKHDKGKPWVAYSNGNIILLALLIEVVSKMSLRDFLREYVFEPLNMKHTYMMSTELNKLADGLLAKPHTISGDGLRSPISSDHIPFLENTVEFAVAGGYITAGDYGRFFKALLQALREKSETSWLDKDFAEFLLELLSEIATGEEYGYAACGFVTKLHERWPGSHSLNRMVSPESQDKEYVLGKGPRNEVYEAHYLAGSATGWASTAYLLRDQEISIVALTNSSGPLDATDRISQLCLSELLDLQPAQYRKGKLIPALLGPASTPPGERSRVHHVELSRRMYEENSKAFKHLEAEDSPPYTSNTGCPNVCGTFRNGRTRQTLQIEDVEGMLRFKVSSSKESALLRFVWTSGKFRICSLPGSNLVSRSIDSHGAWKNRDFTYAETEQLVTCLVRVGLDCVDRFDRVG